MLGGESARDARRAAKGRRGKARQFGRVARHMHERAQEVVGEFRPGCDSGLDQPPQLAYAAVKRRLVVYAAALALATPALAALPQVHARAYMVVFVLQTSAG